MDMDGVVWRGDTLLPGALDWFAWLRSRGIPFVLATNNSSKSPQDYLSRLDRIGVTNVETWQIVTSGTTTADYLKRHYPAGAPVHVLGGDGLRTVVTDAGFMLADEANVVVVGLDPQLTYQKLKAATLLLRRGADYIASNVDRTFPASDGLAPGAGSIVAALSTASDREPVIMGKPHPAMFETALARLGTPAETTLMIGDRLDTDVAGAQRCGIMTVLVLSGVATREDLASSPVQPDAVFENLAALCERCILP
jgi:4-nitrophenyl phosphatase